MNLNSHKNISIYLLSVYFLSDIILSMISRSSVDKCWVNELKFASCRGVNLEHKSRKLSIQKQIELLKKKICKVFQDNGLACTIEANSKIVNFLDVTFDLNTGIYKPFMKENDTPVH